MTEGSHNPSIEFIGFEPKRMRGSCAFPTVLIPSTLPHHIGMVAAHHAKLETTFRKFHAACSHALPENKDKHNSRYGLIKIANYSIAKCEIVFSDQPKIVEHINGMCCHVKAFE